MWNFYKCRDFVSKGRSAAGRTVANNTRVERRGDGAGEYFAIRLHDTDIVNFFPDGAVSLSSGGWRTVTTKARINEYSPVYVTQRRGEWSFSHGGRTYLFADGVTIGAGGDVTGAGEETDRARERKLRAGAGRYASAYVAALRAGKIGAPGGGDCFGCAMVATDGTTPMGGADHIEAHMYENYFVPSLAYRALERGGASIAAKDALYRATHGDVSGASQWGEFIWAQIGKAIKRHCLRELGIG